MIHDRWSGIFACVFVCCIIYKCILCCEYRATYIMYIHDIRILCAYHVYIMCTILRILRMLCIDCVHIMCMLRVYCIFCAHSVYIMCISCVYYVIVLPRLLPSLRIHLVARKPKGIKHASCFFLLRVYAFRLYLFTLYFSTINWLTAHGFILIYLLMRSVVVICSSLG